MEARQAPTSFSDVIALCFALVALGAAFQPPPAHAIEVQKLPNELVYEDLQGRDFQKDLKDVVQALHEEGFKYAPSDGKGQTMLTWTNGIFTSVTFKNVVFLKFNTAVNDPKFENQLYQFQNGFFFHGITGDQIPYMLYLVGVSGGDAQEIVNVIQTRLGKSSQISGLKKFLNAVSDVVVAPAYGGCDNAVGASLLSAAIPGMPFSSEEALLEQAVLPCALSGFPAFWKQASQHFFPDLFGKTWDSAVQSSMYGAAVQVKDAAGGLPGFLNGVRNTVSNLWGMTQGVANLAGVSPTKLISDSVTGGPLAVVGDLGAGMFMKEAKYVASRAHNPAEIGPVLQAQMAAGINYVKTGMQNIEAMLGNAFKNNASAAQQWFSQPIETQAKIICSAIGNGVGSQAGNVLGMTLGTVAGSASWLLVPVAGEAMAATKIGIGAVKIVSGIVDAMKVALKGFPWAAKIGTALVAYETKIMSAGQETVASTKAVVDSASARITSRSVAQTVPKAGDPAAAAASQTTRVAEAAAAKGGYYSGVYLPKEDDLVNDLGSVSQKEWIAGWKAQHNGQDVPRMKDDGHGGQVDITKITDFSKLPPAIQGATKTSFQSAIKDVYEFVVSGNKIGGQMSPSEVSKFEAMKTEAATHIHNAWMESAKNWNPPPDPALMKPYSELPKAEQDKDMKFVNLVIDRLNQIPKDKAAALQGRVTSTVSGTVNTTSKVTSTAKGVVEAPLEWSLKATKALSTWVDGVIPGVTGRTLANIVRAPANIYELTENNVSLGIARWSGKAQQLMMQKSQASDAVNEVTEQLEHAEASGNQIAIKNAEARLKTAQGKLGSVVAKLNYQNLLDQPVTEQGKYEAEQLADAANTGKKLSKADLVKIRARGLQDGLDNQAKNLLMSLRAMKMEEDPHAVTKLLKDPDAVNKLADSLNSDWQATQRATHGKMATWISDNEAKIEAGKMTPAEKEAFLNIKAEIDAGKQFINVPKLKNVAGRMGFNADSTVNDVVDIANTPFDKLSPFWQADNVKAAKNIINALTSYQNSTGHLDSQLFEKLKGIDPEDPTALSQIEKIFGPIENQSWVSNDPMVSAAGSELADYNSRQGVQAAQSAARTVVLMNIFTDSSDALSEVQEKTDQVQKITGHGGEASP